MYVLRAYINQTLIIFITLTKPLLYLFCMAARWGGNLITNSPSPKKNSQKNQGRSARHRDCGS